MIFNLSSCLRRLAIAALLCTALVPALYAQTESSCLAERAALDSANQKVADAQRDVDNAWTICSAYPDQCGRLDSALAKLADAQFAQMDAQMALDSCLNSQPPTPPGGGGGGGGGGTTPTCYQVDYYISYDGGATWEYIGSDYYCDSAT